MCMRVALIPNARDKTLRAAPTGREGGSFMGSCQDSLALRDVLARRDYSSLRERSPSIEGGPLFAALPDF